MARLERLHRLFTYDDWANREALASLRKAGSPPERSLEVFAHILGAKQLWLDRLRRSKQGTPVWPELSLDRCKAALADQEIGWNDYFEDLSAQDFDREIEYVNSKGEAWSSTVGDILNHVLLHSAYHRGQIASALREAGREPAYTDFIHAVRQGFVE